MQFHPLQKTLVPLLRKTLEAYSLRHTATAENIANVGTTKFRPLKVEFESELRRALDKNRPVGRKTADRHMDVGSSDLRSLKLKVDELDAKMNIEREMAELARNQLRFDFVARKLRGKYEMIKSSIRGRVA